jgi:hypothetical protein
MPKVLCGRDSLIRTWQTFLVFNYLNNISILAEPMVPRLHCVVSPTRDEYAKILIAKLSIPSRVGGTTQKIEIHFNKNIMLKNDRPSSKY